MTRLRPDCLRHVYDLVVNGVMVNFQVMGRKHLARLRPDCLRHCLRHGRKQGSSKISGYGLFTTWVFTTCLRPGRKRGSRIFSGYGPFTTGRIRHVYDKFVSKLSHYDGFR